MVAKCYQSIHIKVDAFNIRILNTHNRIDAHNIITHYIAK